MMFAEARESQAPVTQVCLALSFPRSTAYRSVRLREVRCAGERKPPPRSLSKEERKEVLDMLHSAYFVDKAPAVVVAMLLDEGRYLCSVRAMYRILKGAKEVRERRNVARTQNHKKPELIATKPCEVWSWDITKLKGPGKWNYFHLYVIMDIFSRKVVAWGAYANESAVLAEALIARALEDEQADSSQLTLHSDRGAAMKSKTVAELLSDLEITQSFSRPYVSNDNPFSEAQFKTLKYVPTFPDRFGSLEDARVFCNSFFPWYNEEHRHSGLSYFTPHDVHSGGHEAKIGRAHV